MTVTPQMHNPQDVSLTLQTAIKNMTTQAVFYFTIPVAMETLFAPGSSMDVTAFANTWKSIDDSQEASQLLNGKLVIIVLF